MDTFFYLLQKVGFSYFLLTARGYCVNSREADRTETLFRFPSNVKSHAATHPCVLSSVTIKTQLASWLRPKIRKQVPGTSPPVTSKSVAGPCLILISEVVTQALSVRMSAAISAGLVVTGGVRTGMCAAAGAARLFSKLKIIIKRRVGVPSIPKRLARLSLCGGVIRLANGLRIGATARDECFFLANYLPKLLNIFSSMTP